MPCSPCSLRKTATRPFTVASCSMSLCPYSVFWMNPSSSTLNPYSMRISRVILRLRWFTSTLNLRFCKFDSSSQHLCLLFYRGLLTSVQHCAEWVQSTEKQEPIQKCFRSLEYIFKLIIQSRVLFARATGGQYEDNFKRDLYSVFTALNNMLTLSYAVILQTQVSIRSILYLYSLGIY